MGTAFGSALARCSILSINIELCSGIRELDVTRLPFPLGEIDGGRKTFPFTILPAIHTHTASKRERELQITFAIINYFILG